MSGVKMQTIVADSKLVYIEITFETDDKPVKLTLSAQAAIDFGISLMGQGMSALNDEHLLDFMVNSSYLDHEVFNAKQAIEFISKLHVFDPDGNEPVDTEANGKGIRLLPSNDL